MRHNAATNRMALCHIASTARRYPWKLAASAMMPMVALAKASTLTCHGPIRSSAGS
jgi:hypothetical protein